MTLAIARIRFPALLPLLFVNVPCMRHSYRPVFGSYEKRPPSLRMKDKFLVFRLFGETLASERRST